MQSFPSPFLLFLHTTDATSIELIPSNPSYTPKDETQQRKTLFLYFSDGMRFAPCHSSGSDCGPACGRLHSRMASDMRRCKRYDSRLAGADIRFTTRHLFLSSSPLKGEKDKQRRRGGKNDRLDSPRTSFSQSSALQKIKTISSANRN